MKHLIIIVFVVSVFGCVHQHAVARNTIGTDITVINPYTDQMCVDLLEKRANLQVASYILTGISLSPSITTPTIESQPLRVGIAIGAATSALVGGGLVIKINTLSREIERHCEVVPDPKTLPTHAPLEIKL